MAQNASHVVHTCAPYFFATFFCCCFCCCPFCCSRSRRNRRRSRCSCCCCCSCWMSSSSFCIDECIHFNGNAIPFPFSQEFHSYQFLFSTNSHPTLVTDALCVFCACLLLIFFAFLSHPSCFPLAKAGSCGISFTIQLPSEVYLPITFSHVISSKALIFVRCMHFWRVLGKTERHFDEIRSYDPIEDFMNSFSLSMNLFFLSMNLFFLGMNLFSKTFGRNCANFTPLFWQIINNTPFVMKKFPFVVP